MLVAGRGRVGLRVTGYVLGEVRRGAWRCRNGLPSLHTRDKGRGRVARGVCVDIKEDESWDMNFDWDERREQS